MKIRYIVMLLILVAVVGSGYLITKYWMPSNTTANINLQSTSATKIDKNIDLVYVATKGKDIYYHKDSCAKLSSGGRPLPEREVKGQGYKKCPTCYR